MKALTYVHFYGDRNAADPQGRPAQFKEGPHHLDDQSPIEAAQQIARRWHGMETTADDWQIVAEYETVQRPGRVPIPYDRLYIVAYTHEAETAKWADRGVSEDFHTKRFDSSFYLKRIT